MEDELPEVVVTKPLGLSTFRATKSGVSQSSLHFGKCIHNSNFKEMKNSTIGTVEKHIEKMPMPKKFRIALKKKALEEKKEKAAAEKAEKEAAEAAGIKLPKKPRVNKFAYP